MSGIKEIKINPKSELFNNEGMFYKELKSDFRQIRYYTLLIVQKAPVEIKGINLLEQQISELIKNAIKHGNNCDPSKIVKVWYSFTNEKAHLIIEDQGKGFKELENWNNFNKKRNEYFKTQNFEEMEKYISYRTEKSDENDGGNALFAAVEYWNGGVVFNEKRNCIVVLKIFPGAIPGVFMNS